VSLIFDRSKTMSMHSNNESDHDTTDNQNDWNLERSDQDEDEEQEEQNEIAMEGMPSFSQDALTPSPQRDPPTGSSVADTVTTSGPLETDRTAPYTLPSGDLADAKNTLRSHSVEAAAAVTAKAKGMAMAHTRISATASLPLPRPDERGSLTTIPTHNTHFSTPNALPLQRKCKSTC
jgi:hypothetical protein